MMKRPIAILIATAVGVIARTAVAQDMPEHPQRSVASQAAADSSGPPPNVGEMLRHSNGSLFRRDEPTWLTIRG